MEGTDSIKPSPTTWILRLKARKTTIFLHVDPLQTFASIKSQLHTALSETYLLDPETNKNVELPASPSEIQLGRPIDRMDPDGGFVLGEWEIAPSDEDESEAGKSKGKAKPKKNDAGFGSVVKDCPKGAGLKDRDVLVFRWPGDGTGWEDEEDDPKNRMWGVKLASFEDSYGVQNEADLGAGGEFEG
ncbi:unnamed protein product [Periconia digitata]|uniref:Uncharacterized protein n=1 Tax=Periconia digitata TaxID=1303443 RepID=A0A9W4XK94_9PLEO|nr:unnamed protein product [Periconia digitata]